MSGTELSRVRTEFRLRPLERINQSLLESRGPTLLCNQVDSQAEAILPVLSILQGLMQGTGLLLTFAAPAKDWFKKT
jgi:hypothetical protein